MCPKVFVGTTWEKKFFGGLENKETQNQVENGLLGPFPFVHNGTECCRE